MWGFVYQITHIQTGQFYIGCKAFFSTTNKKLSQKRSKELYSGKGRRPKKEKIVKETNWKTYTSSSTKVKEMIAKEGKDKFLFEILEIKASKQELLMFEAFQTLHHFLRKDEDILNEWVYIRSTKPKKKE